MKHVAFLRAIKIGADPRHWRCCGATVGKPFIVSRRKKNGFFGFPNNFIEQQLRIPATTRNWSR
jgi:hypothetical protein